MRESSLIHGGPVGRRASRWDSGPSTLECAPGTTARVGQGGGRTHTVRRSEPIRAECDCRGTWGQGGAGRHDRGFRAHSHRSGGLAGLQDGTHFFGAPGRERAALRLPSGASATAGGQTRGPIWPARAPTSDESPCSHADCRLCDCGFRCCVGGSHISRGHRVGGCGYVPVFDSPHCPPQWKEGRFVSEHRGRRPRPRRARLKSGCPGSC